MMHGCKRLSVFQVTALLCSASQKPVQPLGYSHFPIVCAGLDARAAAIVMRAVRNIVNTGRTIVCTIHQPSIDIFESFDELLLLKRGGETIFNGQLGNDSKDLIHYFQVWLPLLTDRVLRSILIGLPLSEVVVVESMPWNIDAEDQRTVSQ